MDENLKISLMDLAKGLRAPETGLEKHFLKVLKKQAIACTPEERMWYECWLSRPNHELPKPIKAPEIKPPTSTPPMSGNKSIYLKCKDCRFEESAFLLIKKAGLLLEKGSPRLGYVQDCLSQIKCGKCGDSNLQIFTKEKQVSGSYVATASSKRRVFHKSKCGWLVHVPLDSAILFNNREEPIRLGYKPCNSCRP